MSATKLFAKGRAGLVLDQPFFGSLALRLISVEDTSCKTAWTDGKTLGYNPQFIGTVSMDQLKGLICHEVLHCGLQHHTRRGNRDRKKWNMAADYVINLIIRDAGMSLPDGGLIDSSYANMTAEQVYSLLPDQDQQGGSGGEGEGEGDENPDPGGCGEVRDAKGEDGESQASEAEQRQQSQEWKVAMAQAAQQAKVAGNLPGSLERIVKEILEPKLDWREILRRFVDSSAKNDFSWSRPNRRYIGQGLYLPSLYSNELGQVVAAVDTSGSIRQSQLNEFASEINSILEDYRADCTVIYCDHEIDHVDEFPAGDRVSLKAYGGGGTSFVPPFTYLADRGEAPRCMVYFTDGMCDDFPDAPPYPVLWVQKPMRGYGSREFRPPFGEVLVLSE